MTDDATMPAFSDEPLSDAARAAVADRPEQRPLLVVAVASRLEVVVDAPLSLPRSLLPESSAGSGVSSCIELRLKRRSSCLSPSLGAYGRQDAPSRSGQP
jgi:hypothetical protein